IDWMDGMPLTFEMVKTFCQSPNLRQMLDDLVDKNYLVLEHPKMKVGNKREYATHLEKGYNIVVGKLSFEFNRILDPKKIAPTLVATDVSRIAVPVRDGIRSLTIREGLRLFGFPETYCIENASKKDAFDMLGNTVCIPVAKNVSTKLLGATLAVLTLPNNG
ncbi:MAG: DNA cytosine methyltransferase, partial [Defluviitaleaceae bacterium]|nr:DNA cytosine methyltransferase [Defluviitaleaceae bacterium]